ncbi:MAG: hypothetical protein WAZ34_13545 [Rhodocyclaceae bacterium]
MMVTPESHGIRTVATRIGDSSRTMPNSEFLPIKSATDLTKVLSMPREMENERYFADTKTRELDSLSRRHTQFVESGSNSQAIAWPL